MGPGAPEGPQQRRQQREEKGTEHHRQEGVLATTELERRLPVRSCSHGPEHLTGHLSLVPVVVLATQPERHLPQGGHILP